VYWKKNNKKPFIMEFMYWRRLISNILGPLKAGPLAVAGIAGVVPTPLLQINAYSNYPTNVIILFILLMQQSTLKSYYSIQYVK